VDRLLAHPSAAVVTGTHGWLAWGGCQRSRAWARHALRTADADAALVLARWVGADPDSGEDADALRVALGRFLLMPPFGPTGEEEQSTRYTPRVVSRLLCIALARTGAEAAKTELLRLALGQHYGIVGTAQALLEEVAHAGTVPRRTRIWGAGPLVRAHLYCGSRVAI
jgi:hypothetical protein